jgi:hypothetical protein
VTKRNINELPTVADHLEFGRAIKRFDLAMRKMQTGTEIGLGVWRYNKTSRQGKALRRVYKVLLHLKSVMDDDVCAALPSSDLRATRFYYGDDDVEERGTDKECRVPERHRR